MSALKNSPRSTQRTQSV